MDIIIQPSRGLSGEISVPPSKSYGQRALAASLLVPIMEISNLGHSEDELAALEIIKCLGVDIECKNDTIFKIKSSFNFDKDVSFSCGESGLSARLFSGLMMLNKGQTTITGNGSLLQRPINSIFDIYNQLGINFDSKQNFLPLAFTGNRKAIDLEIDGSISSQFITGVLFYFAGLWHSESLNLKIKNLRSRPYLDLTIDTLRQIGAKIEWQGDIIQVIPSTFLPSVTINIEGDWSSASFWIVAAALGGQIKLKGLNPESLQADRVVLDIIRTYGAEVNWENAALTIRSKNNNPLNVDLSDAPDLAPILAVLAIFTEGKNSLRGLERLKHKESNRLDGILNWLVKLQIPYTFEDNNLTVFGKTKINLMAETKAIIEFETNNDHRMVMASSILALFLRGGKVKGIESVKKSYPTFFKDFENLGGQILNY
jgi:3-phosphoshikimate 1-carboxyvinyltransferase